MAPPLSHAYHDRPLTVFKPSTKKNISSRIEQHGCRLKQREDNGCPPNFPCHHGECRQEIIHDVTGSVTRIDCHCDEDWSGETCDRCCDRACASGRCHMTSLGEYYCRCPWGYEGEFCERYAPENATNTGSNITLAENSKVIGGRTDQ